MKRKAVFFDRDGVLNFSEFRNGRSYPPSLLEDVVIPSDAAPALAKLKDAGFLLIGATNQPDVARGLISIETVIEINTALLIELNLDDMKVCYHDDGDACSCRKPKCGMLLEAARLWDIDLSASVMVGDRQVDIDCGKAAGCATVWLCLDRRVEKVVGADYTAYSLTETVDWILAQFSNNVINGKFTSSTHFD